MQRRSAVIPVETPEQKPGIHRCSSCGVGLAQWPRQRICSWCNGDPLYGNDFYFFDIIEEHMITVLIPAGKLERLPDGTKCKDLTLACIAWIDYLSNRRVWGANAHDDEG